MAEGKRTVTAEAMEGIALVTFNLPPANAATAATWNTLAEVLDTYAADPAIRALVLTGAGHHAFVTDPDAAAMDQQRLHDDAACHARSRLAAFPKPVIARIRGDCIGAGLLLALHADLLVAAQDSAFALPGATWGAACDPAAVAVLVRLIGAQQASRLLFTGSRIEAQEALRIGLVTMVVPDADLSDTVVDLARAIADNAPLAVAAGKRMIAAAGDPALGELQDQCRASQDYAAAVATLKSRTRPAFHGR